MKRIVSYLCLVWLVCISAVASDQADHQHEDGDSKLTEGNATGKLAGLNARELPSIGLKERGTDSASDLSFESESDEDGGMKDRGLFDMFDSPSRHRRRRGGFPHGPMGRGYGKRGGRSPYGRQAYGNPLHGAGMGYGNGGGYGGGGGGYGYGGRQPPGGQYPYSRMGQYPGGRGGRMGSQRYGGYPGAGAGYPGARAGAGYPGVGAGAGAGAGYPGVGYPGAGGGYPGAGGGYPGAGAQYYQPYYRDLPTESNNLVEPTVAR